MREPKHTRESNEDFFEAMPATADQYTGSEPGLREIKVTAIITIVLTVVVALGLGLLILRALELMRSVTPV